MPGNLNALQWSGAPGHYEVYYLSATDAGTGVGLWIRYTMVASLPATGEEATCALWFMAMDPASGTTLGRKATFPIAALVAQAQPFELRIDDAVLTDAGMKGAFDDVRWDLRWSSSAAAFEPVHPLLRRAKIAKTILVLPHAHVDVSGTVAFAGRELELSGARGGQAHLWGSKHAARWAWVHCSDFRTLDGEPRPDAFVDAVSVFVPRFGREIGPNTPVVGHFGGRDFHSTSPLRVTRNPSRFALTGWAFEARDGARKVVAEVDARREDLVGVTYHDPDGELAYCYNSETAAMRLQVWDRSGPSGTGISGFASGWVLTETLIAQGRAHFEYAQREPVPGLELHVK